jgi:uncharacterized protein
MASMSRPTAYVTSQYLLVSDRRFRRPDGTTVRPIYATRTAKVVFVADHVADCLRADQIAEIGPDDLRPLLAAKAVVPAGEDERAAVLSRFENHSENRSFRRFTLMPTSNCNMGCTYCGQEHYKPTPAATRIDLLAERVLAAIGDPMVKAVFVSWFGGEPLLAMRTIRDLSAQFTAAAAASGTAYRCNMATNGSLLTMRTLERLYQECMLRSVDITIDGPEEHHDARRFLKNGGRSFRRIVTVLRQVQESAQFPELKVNIRINIDHGNEGVVAELITQLGALGLTGQTFRLQLFPVHSWGNDVSAVEIGKRAYAEKEIEWLSLALQSGVNIELLPTSPRHGTCLATSRSAEILDSEGRMYACSEHPLVPSEGSAKIIATLDSLAPRAERPPAEFDFWYGSVGRGEQQCSGCPVCGGACPKLWKEGHIPCPSIKSNWRQRMDLIALAGGLVPEAVAAV